MSDPLVDLQFQDFGVEPPPKKSSSTTNKPASGGGGQQQPATTFHFTDFPAAAGEDDYGSDDGSGTGRLIKTQSTQNSMGANQSNASFWSFAYYQRLFDVDTDVVLSRILHSMVPRFGTNYILHHIRPNPDLYGPWWIAITLIFAIGIASNLGGYFALSGDNNDYHWSLDFGIVTAAATAIFAYIWLVPLVLYGVFWWRKSEEAFSFMEILCAYGYSLSIYIPISILWMIPYSWFQWILIGLALIMSGSVLVMSLWPAVRHDSRLVALLVMLAVIAVNALLAIGFKMFFFHDIQVVSSAQVNKTMVAANTPAMLVTKMTPTMKPMNSS